MRLSDAIAMGRTIGLPWEHADHEQEGRYCAMQLAALGANGTYGEWVTNLPLVAASFRGEVEATVPCGCKDGEWLHGGPTTSLHRAVMHVFNQHVFEDGTWTLDQLIDWVRSVEPAEEAPSPTNYASCPRIPR